MRADALPPLRPAAFFCAVVPPCELLLRLELECDFLPPRLDAPDAFEILAARSFDMPLSFRASYCFSFLTLGRFPGIRTLLSVDTQAGFPLRARFTHGLRRSNPALTRGADAPAMKLTSLLATAAVTLAAAVSAASAAPADQAGAVKADLTQLQSDITKTHDTLLADLAKITADAGNGRDALRADIQAFRSDRESLVGTVKSDLQQLRSDVKAARDAKVDAGDLKALAQSVRDLAQGDRADVQHAAQAARDAVKSLKSSALPKS